MSIKQTRFLLESHDGQVLGMALLRAVGTQRRHGGIRLYINLFSEDLEAA